jgi:hypothetical protein
LNRKRARPGILEQYDEFVAAEARYRQVLATGLESFKS